MPDIPTSLCCLLLAGLVGMGIQSRNKWEVSRAERAAINTPIQGSAADVASAAMLAIIKDEWLRNNRWKLLLQVC